MKIWGLGFKVEFSGLGFRVQCSGFRVQGLRSGFRVQDLWFWDVGLRFRVEGFLVRFSS